MIRLSRLPDPTHLMVVGLRRVVLGMMVLGCGPSIEDTDGGGDGGTETQTPASDDGGSGMATTLNGGTGAGSTETSTGGGTDVGSGGGSVGEACSGDGPDCVEGRPGGACGDILFPPECDGGVWRCPVGTTSPWDCACYYLEGLWCREGPPEDCSAMVDALCEDGWVCLRGSTPASDCIEEGSSSGSSDRSTGGSSTSG